MLYVVRSGCPWRYLPPTCRPGRPCTGTSSSGNKQAGVTEALLAAEMERLSPTHLPGAHHGHSHELVP
ncbi:hypothetical protein [Nonomuraea basaltis]|uniref:hypothetical protein n=1 Tax=Nonomuraea basaltis TaxID=2495887 RepID=UPI003B849A1E